MNLRYNLYRIYQIIPHISYDLVSNKYQVLISLFLGKSRIPLQIKDSNMKFEFNCYIVDYNFLIFKFQTINMEN